MRLESCSPAQSLITIAAMEAAMLRVRKIMGLAKFCINSSERLLANKRMIKAKRNTNLDGIDEGVAQNMISDRVWRHLRREWLEGMGWQWEGSRRDQAFESGPSNKLGQHPPDTVVRRKVTDLYQGVQQKRGRAG